MSEVVIVDSGVANLASVAGALRRLGAEVRISADAEEVRAAQRLVLPGVGAFGAGMAALRAQELDTVLHDAVERGTPLLAICLGLQLLCQSSEESPGEAGLGLIDGVCRRLPEGVRVPHLGWNRVDPEPGCRTVAPGNAAYANSFALREAPRGWRTAWTAHGVPFVAALECGRILACQFHPELSGAWGAALLRRWLAAESLLPSCPQGSGADEMTGSGAIRRLIPCLDVRDGRVVKGIRFQALRDIGDPAERAALYEAQGADEIVVLDIAASPNARETQVETVRRVRAVLGIPLTVGGGVRSVEDARALLAAGADKVSVNTAAVRRPELLAEMAREFGCQCVVLAIDARRTPAGAAADFPAVSWEVLVMGGRQAAGRDAVEWARRGAALGAGEILLTSWDRDGTRAGHDLELLAAVTREVTVPVIASGGIGTPEHVADALAGGAEAVLAASIFHDGDETVLRLKQELSSRGIPVRI
jgi:imidazole glycerol-phosphate synthase subunit HisF